MKISTKIVYGVNGDVLFEESYDYVGEIAYCGGGSKSTSTPDVTPAPEPVQKVQTKAISESAQIARENQLEKAQRAKGIRSTILTTDDEDSSLLANSQTNNTTTTSTTKSLLGQ